MSMTTAEERFFARIREAIEAEQKAEYQERIAERQRYALLKKTNRAAPDRLENTMIQSTTYTDEQIIEFFRSEGIECEDEWEDWNREVESIDDCREALITLAIALADSDRIMDEHLALLQGRDNPYERSIGVELAIFHQAQQMLGVSLEELFHPEMLLLPSERERLHRKAEAKRREEQAKRHAKKLKAELNGLLEIAGSQCTLRVLADRNDGQVILFPEEMAA